MEDRIKTIEIRAISDLPSSIIDPLASTILPSALLRHPHVAQILVDVMARSDLPTLESLMMRHDPLPPEDWELIVLLGEHAPFDLTEQRPAVFDVEHAALPFVTHRSSGLCNGHS